MSDVLNLVWKALADRTRRRLLDLLKDGPRTTGQLCEEFEMSRFGVMKHLGVLESAGLVAVRRRGRERWNYLNAVPIRRIYERWVSQYSELWATSLLDLKRVAEDTLEGGERAMPSKTEQVGLSAFQLAQEITIDAPRDRVWKALTSEIDRWWRYRLGQEGSKLSLDARVGGQFEERWGDGEGALWGRVLFVDRPKVLRLSGPLGMMTPAVNVYSYELEQKGESGTLLKVTHHSVGELDPKWEGEYDKGWNELLSKYLKSFVEKRRSWKEIDAETRS